MTETDTLANPVLEDLSTSDGGTSTELPTPSSLEDLSATLEPAVSKWKSFWKKVAWCSFAFLCLVSFTIVKLPEDRIQNYVRGYLAAQLAAQGITMTVGHSSLSLGLGLSYTMKDVALSFPDSQDPVKIEEISASPSLLALFTLQAGANLRLENKGGVLKVSFLQSLMRGGPMTLSFDISKLDIGSIGILPFLANVKGSALLEGTGKVSGSLADPSTMNGAFKLDLYKIVLDQQNVMGFSLPRLTVSEGKVDTHIDQGKVKIGAFSLGKTSNQNDDIRGTVTGDITLGKNPQFSTLNLKANVGLSSTLMKAFPLLDAILGTGKQADGTYAFSITGPISAPNPQPLAAGAR